MWPEIWQSDEVDRANRMNALRESLRNQVRRRERQLEATQANSSPQSIRVRRQVYRQQRKYDLTQGMVPSMVIFNQIKFSIYR